MLMPIGKSPEEALLFKETQNLSWEVYASIEDFVCYDLYFESLFELLLCTALAPEFIS